MYDIETGVLIKPRDLVTGVYSNIFNLKSANHLTLTHINFLHTVTSPTFNLGGEDLDECFKIDFRIHHHPFFVKPVLSSNLI